MIQIPKNFKLFTRVLIASIALLSISSRATAEYWLVIGSYRQGPGSKPHVSGITSPSLFAVPTNSLDQCEKAGKQINDKIYKPVWQFDNKWTCIYTGK